MQILTTITDDLSKKLEIEDTLTLSNNIKTVINIIDKSFVEITITIDDKIIYLLTHDIKAKMLNDNILTLTSILKS